MKHVVTDCKSTYSRYIFSYETETIVRNCIPCGIYKLNSPLKNTDCKSAYSHIYKLNIVKNKDFKSAYSRSLFLISFKPKPSFFQILGSINANAYLVSFYHFDGFSIFEMADAFNFFSSF